MDTVRPEIILRKSTDSFVAGCRRAQQPVSNAWALKQ
jgi:hypothetical protein